MYHSHQFFSPLYFRSNDLHLLPSKPHLVHCRTSQIRDIAFAILVKPWDGRGAGGLPFQPIQNGGSTMEQAMSLVVCSDARLVDNEKTVVLVKGILERLGSRF